MTRKQAIEILKARGIQTTADLDKECLRQATADRIPSRFGALKALVGFDAAMWLLHDLAVNQCSV